jgi:hypothetical protein
VRRYGEHNTKVTGATVDYVGNAVVIMMAERAADLVMKSMGA